MSDPHNAFDHNPDNVTYSDTTETNFMSPAISISSVIDDSQTRRVSATNQATAVNSSRANHHAETVDYASNIIPDTSFSYGHAGYEKPFVTIQDTESPPTPINDVHNRPNGKLVLASFGSQPWTAPSGPFLDFAPRPRYKPTGELLHEHPSPFESFDNPAITNFKSPASHTEYSPTQTQGSNLEITSTFQRPDPVDVFVQPTIPRSALKRKADSIESPVADDSSTRKLADQRPEPKRRSVSFERMSGRGPRSPNEGSVASDLPSGQGTVNPNPTSQRRRPTVTNPARGSSTNPAPAPSQPTPRQNWGTRAPSGHPPSILPPEKVFPIQIGSDLFRLSGASISSDAPSYFTQFFEEQLRQNEESGGVRTLYIDRDPATFRDVARHLQGYYVKPRDGSHFVKLFADAQFYSLPRLIDQLFESEIFIQIGERHFQIPKDIFSEPGNSPNFFSLGFAVFFSTPGEVFPGLDRRGLLRPPSITPPYVPGRSAEIFAELLHLLRGYPLHIRNECHRAELLRDCRYFHLRGLEQRIIAHEISFNLERQKHEICLRLEDVKPSGVSFSPENLVSDQGPTTGGWVYYARPFVDDTSYEMVVEIGGECTTLDLDDMKADFHNLTKARVSSLFQVVANKMNLPTNAPLGLMMLSGGSQSSQSASPGQTPLSEDRVKVRFEPATFITLDGEPYTVDWESRQGQIMSQGPAALASESDSGSDIVSEDTPAQGSTAHRPRQTPSSPTQQKRPSPGLSRQQQKQPVRGSVGPSAQQTTRSHLPVPPIQTTRLPTPSGPSTAAPAPKKRKRQSAGSREKRGEWTVRTAQWRLRVQPNPNDKIRGGYEIVFVGVKVDAYSSERARNGKRAFLG